MAADHNIARKFSKFLTSAGNRTVGSKTQHNATFVVRKDGTLVVFNSSGAFKMKVDDLLDLALRGALAILENEKSPDSGLVSTPRE